MVLTIKKKWFDMIKSGVKKEEYREIKPYYTKRFANILNIETDKYNLKDYLCYNLDLFTHKPFEVKLRNGYNSKSPYIICKCRLKVDQGKEEWGAEKNKQYYVLEIIEIMEVNE